MDFAGFPPVLPLFALPRGAAPLAFLREMRLASVWAALLEVPAWEYLLLLAVLAFVCVCVYMDVHPLAGLWGDRPSLTFNPRSPVARLIQDHMRIPRQLLTTPDGGTLALDWADPSPATSAPASQKQEAASGAEDGVQAGQCVPIAVIVPGLSSDSNSQYVKHCVAAIAKKGWRVLVVNHRGLGGVKITSSKLYNAGWTEDLDFVVRQLKQNEPDVDLYAVGTSMGGNILVKYLGETGAACLFRAAVVVGCPWDLLICDRWMNRRLMQRLYNTAMALSLKAFALQHKEPLSKLVSMKQLSRSRSIRQFDDYITRIIGNYETVDTYYRRTSSSQFLPTVAVPTLCISAQDDPICTGEALPWAEARNNPNVVLAVTGHGGHLAFLQGLAASNIWWTPVAADFLEAVRAFLPQDARPEFVGQRPLAKQPGAFSKLFAESLAPSRRRILTSNATSSPSSTSLATLSPGDGISAPAAAAIPGFQSEASQQQLLQPKPIAVVEHALAAGSGTIVTIELPSANPAALVLLQGLLVQVLEATQAQLEASQQAQKAQQRQSAASQQEAQPPAKSIWSISGSDEDLAAMARPAAGQAKAPGAAADPNTAAAAADSQAPAPHSLHAAKETRPRMGPITATGSARWGSTLLLGGEAERLIKGMFAEYGAQQRLASRRREASLLLLHSAVAVAGPLAAAAIALRLRRHFLS